MEITLTLSTPNHVLFTLAHADVSLANALRRIMLSEVETMAIEYVDLERNDSALHDEILCHRLGLIPVLADPDLYDYCSGRDDLQPGKNCIVFEMNFQAKTSAKAKDGSVHVLAKEFKGETRFVNDDVMIAKLQPGQGIKAKCYAVKGVGAEHTKWSPACTAAYRMTPSVGFKEKVRGEEAKELKAVCPRNVFDIEDGVAVVANQTNCSMCRECKRDPRWGEHVELGRIPGLFSFSVESTGAISAKDIVKRSFRVLKAKCTSILQEIDALEATEKNVTEQGDDSMEEDDQ